MGKRPALKNVGRLLFGLGARGLEQGLASVMSRVRSVGFAGNEVDQGGAARVACALRDFCLIGAAGEDVPT